MSVTEEQRYVIDCVLAIFETGELPTATSYSTCTILKDGAGISYGKHQCTDKAGSLDLVCQRYIDLGGLQAEALKPYMPKLATNESAKVDTEKPYPAWLQSLISLLVSVGSEAKMQQAQDEIFNEKYWLPAVAHADEVGLKTALGHLVIYDTCIHSGPDGVKTIRNKFPESSPSKGGNETLWVLAYIKARGTWLATYSNPDNPDKEATVRSCVYRTTALKAIADANNWELKTPLEISVGKKKITIPAKATTSSPESAAGAPTSTAPTPAAAAATAPAPTTAQINPFGNTNTTRRTFNPFGDTNTTKRTFNPFGNTNTTRRTFNPFGESDI